MQLTQLAVLALAAAAAAATPPAKIAGGDQATCDSEVLAKEVSCINKCDTDNDCSVKWYVVKSR